MANNRIIYVVKRRNAEFNTDGAPITTKLSGPMHIQNTQQRPVLISPAIPKKKPVVIKIQKSDIIPNFKINSSNIQSTFLQKPVQRKPIQTHPSTNLNPIRVISGKNDATTKLLGQLQQKSNGKVLKYIGPVSSNQLMKIYPQINLLPAESEIEDVHKKTEQITNNRVIRIVGQNIHTNYTRHNLEGQFLENDNANNNNQSREHPIKEENCETYVFKQEYSAEPEEPYLEQTQNVTEFIECSEVIKSDIENIEEQLIEKDEVINNEESQEMNYEEFDHFLDSDNCVEIEIEDDGEYVDIDTEQTELKLESESQGNEDSQEISMREESDDTEEIFCDICGRIFEDYRKVYEHVVRLHAKTEEERNTEYVKQAFEQVLAGGWTLDLKKARKPRVPDTRQKVHKCENCDKCFATIHGATVHNRVSHRAKSEQRLTPGCKFCGRVYKNSDQLAVHQRNHTGEKPYECTDCGRRFTSKTYLKNHASIHTGVRRFICKHCSMTFRSQSNFQRHVKIHTGEKPYVCSTCGKAFVQPTSLKEHVKYVHLAHKRPKRIRRK